MSGGIPCQAVMQLGLSYRGTYFIGSDCHCASPWFPLGLAHIS